MVIVPSFGEFWKRETERKMFSVIIPSQKFSLFEEM